MRRAARLLVVDTAERVLLIHVRDPARPAAAPWWEVPGGGLKPGEDAVLAVVREVAEETGYRIAPHLVGPALWERVTEFSWCGRDYRQQETLHVARWPGTEPPPAGPARPTPAEDGAILGLAWWPVDDLRTSRERFFPGPLPAAVPELLAGRPVDEPYERWEPVTGGGR